jgi:hypothetical protein
MMNVWIERNKHLISAHERGYRARRVITVISPIAMQAGEPRPYAMDQRRLRCRRENKRPFIPS